MDKWNRPIPVRWRLSLTKAVRGKIISTGLALTCPGYENTEPESILEVYFVFHLQFVHKEACMNAKSGKGI